jgi:hypothetical protein
MDIVVWLRSLGLGTYEGLFHENDIDEKVLLTLTAEDLKELGVTSFGHRRKLLDAIATLRGDASGRAPSVDPSSAPQAHIHMARQVFRDIPRRRRSNDHTPEVANVTGKYFYKCRPTTPSAPALDDRAALALWERSAALVDMRNNGRHFASG